MENTNDVGNLLKSFWIKLFVGLFLLVVLSLMGLCTFRTTFVDFVDNYELAYKYDRRDGTITRLDRTGYFLNPPVLVNVHSIDLRPMQVCISAIQRVLNCKLVQFNPEGLELFLEWHGRGNYNAGSMSTFNEILKAYAYEGSGKNYPFLTVIRELKPGEVDTPAETRR